ncbi:hypothetical protein D3C87_1068090 [compost metagenome]
MAFAQHAGAARAGHVAVRLVAGRFHAPALRADRRHVRGRPHLGLVQVARRAEKADGGAMAHLPQVVVAERDAAAQLLGIGAVIVVQAHAGAPRAAVLDFQVHVHGAGQAALLDQGHHLALGPPVQGRQFHLRLRKIGHLAFRQGRHLLAHVERRVVLRTDHAQAPHLCFAHLQHHHALLHLLLGQVHVDGLVAAGLICGYEGVARPFHVLQGAARPQEGRDRFFDGTRVEHGIAAHQVFLDRHLPFRRGHGGGCRHRVLRARHAGQRQHGQAQHRQGPCRRRWRHAPALGCHFTHLPFTLKSNGCPVLRRWAGVFSVNADLLMPRQPPRATTAECHQMFIKLMAASRAARSA